MSVREKIHQSNINAWVLFIMAIYLVLLIKFITIKYIDNNVFFGIYSITVSVYILSRFIISSFYHSGVGVAQLSDDELPTVSFAVPSKNEGENIKKTILQIAKSDYPKNKFDVIAINDGSTDDTLIQMEEAQKEAAKLGVSVKVVDWKINRGKREGMAECVIRSKNDIIIFIDSDSFVEAGTARNLVKYFVDNRIAAVAGHAYVANEDTNALTKMQSVRYV